MMIHSNSHKKGHKGTGIVQKRETPRRIRVANEVKKVLSEFLLRGTFSLSFDKDNNSDNLSDNVDNNSSNSRNIASMIAITDVTISADLQHAKIFIASISPQNISSEMCIDFLEKNIFRLRAHVGTQIRLKHVPELRFFIDDSMDKAERIENLLKTLNIPE